jgi:hypothetical protein
VLDLDSLSAEMEVLTEAHRKWAALWKETCAKMQAQCASYRVKLEKQKKEHETAMERMSELHMTVRTSKQCTKTIWLTFSGR